MPVRIRWTYKQNVIIDKHDHFIISQNSITKSAVNGIVSSRRRNVNTVIANIQSIKHYI